MKQATGMKQDVSYAVYRRGMVYKGIATSPTRLRVLYINGEKYEGILNIYITSTDKVLTAAELFV